MNSTWRRAWAALVAGGLLGALLAATPNVVAAQASPGQLPSTMSGPITDVGTVEAWAYYAPGGPRCSQTHIVGCFKQSWSTAYSRKITVTGLKFMLTSEAGGYYTLTGGKAQISGATPETLYDANPQQVQGQPTTMKVCGIVTLETLNTSKPLTGSLTIDHGQGFAAVNVPTTLEVQRYVGDCPAAARTHDVSSSDGVYATGPYDQKTGTITYNGQSVTVPGRANKPGYAGTPTQTYSASGSISATAVEITASPETATLLDREVLEAHLSPSAPGASNYKFELKRADQADWTVFRTTPQSSVRFARRVAGHFDVRAIATVQGEQVVSASQPLVVQFPSYSDIVSDDTVRKFADAAWATTLRLTKPTEREEIGYWISVDTCTIRYWHTAPAPPTVVGPTEGVASISVADRRTSRKTQT